MIKMTKTDDIYIYIYTSKTHINHSKNKTIKYAKLRRVFFFQTPYITQ
jgi:hypothetical protein